jgi:hypothetical protein
LDVVVFRYATLFMRFDELGGTDGDADELVVDGDGV